MIILGLDIATTTGWCLYPDRHLASIRTGSIRVKGGEHEAKAADLASKLVSFVKANGKPGLAVIEQPMRHVQPFRKQSRMLGDQGVMTMNAGTALLLNQLAGAAVGVLAGFQIPFAVVPVQTWRASYFPKGTKGKDRADWKRLAKLQADQLRIPVANADEAEAIGIALYGPRTAVYRELADRQARAA